MESPRQVGTFLLILCLACGITSTALDWWYYVDKTLTSQSTKRFSAYFGLWNLCVRDANYNYECDSWGHIAGKANTDIAAWLQACRAMMIIGVLFNALACVSALRAKKVPVKSVRIQSFLTGIFYAIAVIVFIAKYQDSVSSEHDGGTLHAGFGLAIVAALLSVIAICVLGKVEQQPDGSYQQI